MDAGSSRVRVAGTCAEITMMRICNLHSGQAWMNMA